MVTSADLTQAWERANEFSRVLKESLPEDKDAARELALAHSVLSMLRPPVAVSAQPTIATWSCELLILLEDGLSSTVRDVPAAEAVYKAISRLQEALGVPEDERAWIFEEEGSAG